MVDSIQQIMILGMREAQIMLLPDQIDLCTNRMSHIIDLKVRVSIIILINYSNLLSFSRMNNHFH
jgi:hypothetical protein